MKTATKTGTYKMREEEGELMQTVNMVRRQKQEGRVGVRVALCVCSLAQHPA